MYKKAEAIQEPLTLKVQDIIDYTVCGLYFDCKVNRSEPYVYDNTTIRNERFENTMKSVIYHYFFKRLAGQYMTLAYLSRKWEKLWYPKKMTAYDIALERNPINHDGVVAYAGVAVSALEKLIENFANPSIEPFLIDEDYLIQLSPSLRLKGVFDLVLKMGDEYRVLKLVSKKNRPVPHL